MPNMATLGFRSHSGWTAVVAAGRVGGKPGVFERLCLPTCDPSLRGSKQPFHTAEPMPLPQAEALIRKCRDSSSKLATAGVKNLVQRLAQHGMTVTGAAVLCASGRPLPDLAAILRSHALIHTAEGAFYRDILVTASESCSLPVARVKERDVWVEAAAALHLDVAALEQRIAEIGKSLGPPWRQDEKLAALAAWIVWAGSKS